MTDPLRQHLLDLLGGGNAHATLDQAVSDMPLDKQGSVAPPLPHSPWQLLEHIRLALEDMLDFSDNQRGTYRKRKWPDDYWPKTPAPPSRDSWSASVAQIHAALERFEGLLSDPARDLTAPFLWSEQHTLLQEALQIADHNAYHVGQLVTLRQLLGAWNPD